MCPFSSLQRLPIGILDPAARLWQGRSGGRCHEMAQSGEWHESSRVTIRAALAECRSPLSRRGHSTSPGVRARCLVPALRTQNHPGGRSFDHRDRVFAARPGISRMVPPWSHAQGSMGRFLVSITSTRTRSSQSRVSAMLVLISGRRRCQGTHSRASWMLRIISWPTSIQLHSCESAVLRAQLYWFEKQLRPRKLRRENGNLLRIVS